MTKKDFKQDLLRGLGSALVELKASENPQRYYDIVLYACLHDTTYDMQSEGDRGYYLYQAAIIVGGLCILQEIIKSYSRNFSDYWLFVQLTSLLYHFAKSGKEIARRVLEDKYTAILVKTQKNRISLERDMFDYLCVTLTSLNGWPELKKIINDVSQKLLSRELDFFFSEWFYIDSKTKFGKKRLERYLMKEAEKSTFIKRYWQKAQEWDQHVYVERANPTLNDVIKEVGFGKYHGRGLSMRFAKNANKEELKKLYQIAMEEQDLQKGANLLWGLRWASVTIPKEIVSKMLESDNEDIKDTAFYIIEKHPSKEARIFALSLLESNKDIVYALSVLSKNILKEDEQLFSDTIKSIPVKLLEGDWHSAFMSAEVGIRKIPGKPKTELLEYVYRESYCSLCRLNIVRLMHKKKLLSDSLLQECLYDSNIDIRRFAERSIKIWIA